MTRAEYTKGLRALADAIDGNDDLPLPSQGSISPITIQFLHGDDPRAAMGAAARAIPCNWRKNTWEGSSGTAYFDLTGELDGLHITLTAFRDTVCERVVTGTREVTRTVKDPEAIAAVPEVEVTETVEDVEWRCGSLLAPEGQASA